MKYVKIPKRQSETLIQRTYNIMTKRKETKIKTVIYKTLHRKPNIEKREPHKNNVIAENYNITF